MKLQTSTDYAQFEIMDFNRDVFKTKKLELSMKTHGWIPAYPAHVIKTRGKLLVKAGHHRVSVAMKLNIPIVYVVCEDNITIFQLEQATNRWTIDDYLTSFVRLGDPDYIKVNRYKKQTGISTGLVISMLGGQVAAGGGNFTNAFRSGEFKVKTTELIDSVASIIKTMQDCGIKWAHNSLIVQSISRIIIAGHADIPRLKNKIKTFSTHIKKQPTLQTYTEMFEEIYNRQSKEKLPLTFLTNKTLKQRQENFGG